MPYYSSELRNFHSEEDGELTPTQTETIQAAENSLKQPKLQVGLVEKPDEQPQTLPFMAVDKTSKGEPVYSEQAPDNAPYWQKVLEASGIHEFIRQKWATIFDPQKIQETLSAEEKQNFEAMQNDVVANIESKLSWSTVFEPLLGITAEEVGQVASARLAEESKMDAASTAIGITTRTVGQEVMGLLQMFSAAEIPARVGIGISLELDRLSKENEVTASEKSLYTTDVLGLHRVVKIAAGYINGSITADDLKDSSIRAMYASRAVYSLVYDQTLRNEFNNRYSSGTNPALIVAETKEKHPYVEMAGSILLDPTTYMGLGLAKRVGAGAEGARYLSFMGKDIKWLGKQWKTLFYIPEFGELFKIGVGKTRILAEAADIKKPIKELVPYLDDMKRATTTADAQKTIKAVYENIEKAIKKPNYGVFAGTADTKAKVLLRDTAQVFEALAGMPETPGKKIKLIRSMVDAASGKDIPKAFANFMSSSVPGLFMSDQGMRAATVLGRLADSTQVKKLIDTIGKGDTFLPELIKLIENVAHEIYPSVDEMEKGWKAYKAGTKTEQALRLYEAYNNLDPTVKYVRKIVKPYEKVWNWNKSYLGTVFFALSGKFPSRNVFGQLFPSITQLGLIDGAWVGAKSLTGYLGDTLTNRVLAKQAEDITKVLGVLPRRAETGLGVATEFSKSWGFAKIAQRIESIASGEITLIAAKKIMKSAMDSGALPKVEEIAKLGFNDTQAKLFRTLLEENFGNGAKTINDFVKATANGQIEKWRFIKPNPKLQDALDRFGLGEAFGKAQREAGSAVEFQETIAKALSDAKNNVDDFLRETHAGGLSKDVPPELQQMMTHVDEAKRAGTITGAEADALENVIQAQRNVRSAAGNLKNNLIATISETAGKMGIKGVADDVAGIANGIEKEFNSAMYVVDKIRNQTLKSIESIRAGGNYQKVWHELKSGKLYDLEKMFPGVDPMTLDQKEIIDYIWRGYFEGSGSIYNNSNVSFINSIVSNLTDYARKNGVAADFMKKVQKDVNHIMKLADNAQAWEKEYMLQKMLAGKSASRGVGDLLNAFGIPTADKSGKPIRAGLDFLNKQMGTAFEQLDEINFDDAKNALIAWREGKLGKKAKTAVDVAKKTVDRIKIVEEKIVNTPEANWIREWTNNYVFQKGRKEAIKSAEEFTGRKIIDIGNSNDTEAAYAISGIVANIDKHIPESVPVIFGHGVGFGEDWKFLNMGRVSEKVNEVGGRAYVIACDSSHGRNFATAEGKFVEYVDGKLVDVAETTATAVSEIPKATKPIPPYIEGTVPNKARVFYESYDELAKDVAGFVRDVSNKWDELEPVPSITAETIGKLDNLVSATSNRMAEARVVAGKFAEATRDFILHDYNKTYLDAAVAYWSPFHYWQTRTYMRGIEAILYAPKWAHFYNTYKETLSQLHAGLPDYWKNSIKVDNILGIELESPLFFNLEATLNPYYNMLGTDFNDPNKRVDFLSRTVMDVSNLGYSPIPLVNWAIALNLFRKNEDEAAQRYLGRLIPQSPAIKAFQAKTNKYLPDISVGNVPIISHGEIDPFVNWMMGGLDPYERKRVGRKGAEMIAEGVATPEEVFDASIIQQGKTWYDMVERALDERANGQLFSEFVGVGFKPRTPGDMLVDEFYAEMFHLMGVRDNMSSEQYRLAWNSLREKYPFADIVLLSGKSGAEREAAIAYGTLSRIQPGLQTELLKTVGLSSDDIDRFYADKGNMENWNPQDREAFNSGVARLAFITRIPTTATRNEWEQARFMYSEMKDRISSQLGDNIWDLVYGVPQDGAARQRFYEQYPQVLQAYDLQKQYMIANPLLNAYYGGIETIGRYYDDALKNTMREKYGEDIYERYYAYLDQPTNELKKDMLSSDKSLKAFINDKSRSQLQDLVNRKVGEMAALLPETKKTEFRNVEGGIGQEAQAATQTVTAQQITDAIMAENGGQELMEIIRLYANGDEMPYPAQQRLEYIGQQFGLYSWNQVIQILLGGM